MGSSADGIWTERSVRITGRVQGVGFRWWTRSRAMEAGLSGKVWNCPDGSVRVDIGGPEPVVTRFLHVLQEGPPAATVRDVEAATAAGPVPRSDFSIVTSREGG